MRRAGAAADAVPHGLGRGWHAARSGALCRGAYLASVLRAAEVDGWPAHLATGFTQALDELREHSGLDAAALCDPDKPRTQRCFSEAVDKQAFVRCWQLHRRETKRACSP